MVELGRGIEGAAHLGATCGAVVVVDVLRFTTAVTVAVARGASVSPVAWDGWTAGAAPARTRSGTGAPVASWRKPGTGAPVPTWADRAGAALAAAHGAVLAGAREDGGVSLSPAGLARVGPGDRIVLPSPNGAACALAAAACGGAVVAASLRNATAAGAWAAGHAQSRAGGAGPVRLGVVAAGEATAAGGRRVAWEDDLGAGAVLASLVTAGWDPGPGTWPAVGEWAAVPDLRVRAERLASCPSGRELVDRGWADDVEMAAEHDVCVVVPVLRHGAFVAA